MPAQPAMQNTPIGWNRCEFVHSLATQFVYSKYNYLLWALQIAANIFALHWTVYHHLGDTEGHHESWFVVLEVSTPLLVHVVH